MTGTYELTPEDIKQVWDSVRKPNASKVAVVLRQHGVQITRHTLLRMKARGWVEVRRNNPRGRPRISEKKKTLLNKSIMMVGLLSGDPEAQAKVPEALGLSEKVLDFLAGMKGVSFADVADELNKAFARCITAQEIAITVDNLIVKSPREYAIVQPVLTDGFRAANEPKVLGNFVDSMKTVGSSSANGHDTSELGSFLSAHGG